MPVVFRKVAETFKRVEEDIFAPGVNFAIRFDLAPLEANHFISRSTQFAPSSQWNERSKLHGRLELLQDLYLGILRVQDRVAASTDHVDGLAERAYGHRAPAIGAA